MQSCVGILGGRPNHALYFTGSANGHLLFLDPHTCHDAIQIDDDDSMNDEEDEVLSIDSI